jgi:hypothetical protein
MIMRFRPANIRLINRRLKLPRLLLALSSRKRKDNYKNIPTDFAVLTGSLHIGGGIRESGLNQWQLTRDALWYTADNQSRSAVSAPVWQDAQQVKFARALMGNRSVAAVTASYTRSGSISWRQVADTSAEPECRMAQTAAAGGIVWYHWLGSSRDFSRIAAGRLPDANS